MFGRRKIKKWIDEAEYYLLDNHCRVIHEAKKLEKRRHRKKAWKGYVR